MKSIQRQKKVETYPSIEVSKEQRGQASQSTFLKNGSDWICNQDTHLKKL